MKSREALLEAYMAAAAFADEHSEDNPDRLLLNAAGRSGIDMKIVASTLESRRRLLAKAPMWARTPGLVFPRTISAQQCSGELSAAYKAGLAALFQPSIVADLTGGIGVDTLALSRICTSCHYNEMDDSLCAAAELNFQQINKCNKDVYKSNIFVSSYSASKDDPEFVDWLRKISPDLIYLDPARRDGSGNKVFLMEDCSPDVVSLQELLLSVAPTVMIKLSTMADLSMVISRLRHCSMLRILEYGGECRELVALLQRDYEGECSIAAVNLDLGNDLLLECHTSDFATTATIAPSEDIVCGNYIFEPSKSLMKTGCFGLISRVLGAGCVGRDSHFYILTPQRIAELGELPLLRSGRISRILEAASLSKRSLRDFAGRYPCAETIARNVRFSSEDLRARLGCRPSDSIRIFALGTDSSGEKILIAAERVQNLS